MNKLLPLLFAALAGFLFYSCKPKPVGGVLEKTYWDVTTLKSGNQRTVLDDSTRIFITFAAESLSGVSTCNRYAADFTTDGPNLTLSPISSTKRMCDAMQVEDLYLSLLENATSYSVLEDQLVIFSRDGEITCIPMPEADIKELRYKEGIGKLEASFQPVEASGMLHLFPIVRVDNPGNYPYQGKPIDPGLYKFFDAQSSEIWNSTGGDVLAVGKYQDFYICRVPGRYVSSDIALFRMEDGRMNRIETVAWAWCDEGWCNQQDAWLTDFNRDGRTDIVQHYTLTDDKGKIREERITVLLQDEDGSFTEDKEVEADQSLFEMAEI